MFRRLLAIAAISAAVAIKPTSAQQTSLGIVVGTPGVGVELGHDLSDEFAVRATGHWFQMTRGVRSDGFKYEGKLKLFSLGVLGDWYMSEGGLRLSAGAFYANTRVNLATSLDRGPPTSNTTVRIGGTDYRQGGRLDANVAFNKLSPYVGAGYTTNRGQAGLSFTFDAGVMVQGAPKITFGGNRPDGAVSQISWRKTPYDNIS